MAAGVDRWLPGPFPAGAVIVDSPTGGAVVAAVVPGSLVARMDTPAVAVGERVVAVGTAGGGVDTRHLGGAATAAAIKHAMGADGVGLRVVAAAKLPERSHNLRCGHRPEQPRDEK